MRERVKNISLWLVSAVLLVLADQYTKMRASAHLKGQGSYVIWDGVFELFYHENRGAAFGMMQGKQAFFFVVAVIVVAAAVYMMWRMPPLSAARYHGLRICVTLITAGALGNMLDRTLQGYVVDFFYFSLINFPIFNVADIYVTVATAVLLLLFLFYYKDEELACFQWKKKAPQGDQP